MADRRLVSLFPKAAKIEDNWNLDLNLDAVKKVYGELPYTFFNMEIYKNPIGIELETEDFLGTKAPIHLFSRATDNSLKKHGCEFISMPLSGVMIDYALKEIDLLCKNSGVSFGHRTSVHVHVNVSEYTWNQLVTLVALYALLEEVYYSFVNETRRANTFCYRILGTSPKVKVFPHTVEGGGQTTKYCAFNIHPISRQLSVEFRHLEGTGDKKRLRRWIQICSKLVNYVGTLDPATCRQDLIAAIQKQTVQTEWVPKIWGHTAMIFDRELIRSSIDKGELWAMTILTEKL